MHPIPHPRRLALLTTCALFFAIVCAGQNSSTAPNPITPAAPPPAGNLTVGNTTTPAGNTTATSGNTTTPAGNTSVLDGVTTIPPGPIPPNTYPIDPRAATTPPPDGSADCAECTREREVLQAAMMHFPLLTPATDSQGRPAFQTWPIKNPLVFNGKYYYGFRFTVPPRQHDEDLVWGFVYPFFREGEGWAIIPPNGIVYTTAIGTGNYFQDVFYVPLNIYKGLPKMQPTFQKEIYLQHLDGKTISDGSTYLIYFVSDKLRNPLTMSLKLTFATVDPSDSDSRAALETILGLVRKNPPSKTPAPEDKPAPAGTTPTS